MAVRLRRRLKTQPKGHCLLVWARGTQDALDVVNFLLEGAIYDKRKQRNAHIKL
jgi:hypothetical protein